MKTTRNLGRWVGIITVLGGFMLFLVAISTLLKALFTSRMSQVAPTSTPTTTHLICTNEKVYKILEEAVKDPDNVCYLDLSNNNLTQLPGEVLKLKNLTSLYLNFNHLDSLPPEIAKLPNLTSLDLTGNPMSQAEVDKVRRLLPGAHVLFVRPMSLP